jgi:hypothetical protein
LLPALDKVARLAILEIESKQGKKGKQRMLVKRYIMIEMLDHTPQDEVESLCKELQRAFQFHYAPVWRFVPEKEKDAIVDFNLKSANVSF